MEQAYAVAARAVRQRLAEQHPDDLRVLDGIERSQVAVYKGTFDQVEKAFYAESIALIEGGVDLFLIETAQDTLNLKATVLAVQRAMRDAGVTLPVMISVTIEPMGTMLGGQSIDWPSSRSARNSLPFRPLYRTTRWAPRWCATATTTISVSTDT